MNKHLLGGIAGLVAMTALGPKARAQNHDYQAATHKQAYTISSGRFVNNSEHPLGIYPVFQNSQAQTPAQSQVNVTDEFLNRLLLSQPRLFYDDRETNDKRGEMVVTATQGSTNYSIRVPVEILNGYPTLRQGEHIILSVSRRTGHRAAETMYIADSAVVIEPQINTNSVPLDGNPDIVAKSLDAVTRAIENPGHGRDDAVITYRLSDDDRTPVNAEFARGMRALTDAVNRRVREFLGI